MIKKIIFLIFSFGIYFIVSNGASAHLIYPYKPVYKTPILSSIKNNANVRLAQDAPPEVTPVEKREAPSLEGEEAPPQPLNPQELKDAIRQTSDLIREIRRLKKQAVRNKVNGVTEELNALEAQVIEFQKRLKAAKIQDGREVLEDFWQENFWEQINPLRIKIDLPNELREIAKRLKEAERMLATQSTQKAFTGLGINLEAVKSKLAEIRAAYENTQNLYNAGNIDEVDEAMQVIREPGNHPGNILGILSGARETWNRLRQIRDQAIRDAIKEVLQPIIDAINDSDYQEAQFLQNEIGQELDRIFIKAMQANMRSNNRNDILKRLDKLENLLGEKSNDSRSFETGPQAVPEKLSP